MQLHVGCMLPIRAPISAGAFTRNLGWSPHHPYTNVLALFSLYSAQDHSPVGFTSCLSTSRIRTSTDCQGSLAPKWKENVGRTSGDRTGAKKGLWPPQKDGFSSTVKNKWPTEISCLWLSKKVPRRQWFSKCSMHKSHLDNWLNMQNAGPHCQIFSINNLVDLLPGPHLEKH